MPDNSFVPGVALYSPRGKLSVGRGRYDELNRLRLLETTGVALPRLGSRVGLA